MMSNYTQKSFANKSSINIILNDNSSDKMDID